MSTSDDLTPPSWFSYTVFRDESLRVAEALDHLVMVSTKRIDLLNFTKARRAKELADHLRHLSKCFGRWDALDPETVAAERTALVPQLSAHLAEALAMLEALPTEGSLGKVRRPR